MPRCSTGTLKSPRQLRKLLTQGDELRPAANPRITLKNFMAAGSQATAWIAEVIDTCERSEQLLLKVQDQLRLQAGTYRNGQIEITGKTLTASP